MDENATSDDRVEDFRRRKQEFFAARDAEFLKANPQDQIQQCPEAAKADAEMLRSQQAQ